MKNLIFILLTLFIFKTGTAQIFATTSAGRQVILYQDGTWKYQGSGGNSEQEKPCIKNKTANLTITNKSENDIYFYYTEKGSMYATVSYQKVKAGTSKSVTNLRASNSTSFIWNATLEIDVKGTPVQDMQGISRGEFSLTPCETEEIEVDN